MTEVAQPALKSRRPIRMQEIGLLVVIALLYIALGIAGKLNASGRFANDFLNFDNQFNGIATSMSIYAIMAVGMTCVIITGGIDISVGSILGLASLSGAYVLQTLPESSPWFIALPVGIAVPVLVGGLCGAINGGLIVGMRVHPFIITLGTMSIFRCICDTQFPKSLPEPSKNLPDIFRQVMSYNFGGGLRLAPVIITLIVVALGWIFLHFSVGGRETYAIGGNLEAARYSGIRVKWATMRVYILMGLCAGVASLVQLGRFNSASTDNGSGDELLVIASAVVGGASLTGGRGTALGALLGALIIKLIENGILILHYDTRYTRGIVGSAIILAVGVDSISRYFGERRSRSS